MKMNMRTFALSMMSGGLLALGSSIAFADSVNNVDNTTPGESGHGTNCSNHPGGCYSAQQSSSFGSYQQTSEPSAGMSTNANTTVAPATPAPAPADTTTGCVSVTSGVSGHCMYGPGN
jgi:hypothetical protein